MKDKLTRRVLKAIGVLSGAEALGILCSVIKMKLVALWLGAMGVGLFGIFNTSIDTISLLTGLGLRQSGVREVAQNKNNPGMLNRIARSLRGWCLMSGGIGALIVCGLSPWLSYIFFDNYSYWWQFMIVSGALLFNALCGGEQAILQGTGHIKKYAKASVYGSFAGLAISVPMFRFMGDKSVVFSIIAYSLCILLFLFFFRNRNVPYSLPSRREFNEGKSMAKLGGYMAVAAFATNLAQMIFISWLNRDASTVEVGYYQAGNVLVYRYTSLVFGAIGLEFYPRMASQSRSRHRMSLFVSHEIDLLLKVFTPLLIIFILLRHLIVEILYTPDFEVVVPFITIGIFTIVLRSISVCMAVSIIAKGDGKMYLFTESADAVIGLTLNILLYKSMGLIGLGIAQVAWYGIYTIMIGIVYFFRYRLKITREALWSILFYSTVCAGACVTAALI